MMKRLKKISIAMFSVAVMSIALAGCSGCGKEKTDVGNDTLAAVVDRENISTDTDITVETKETLETKANAGVEENEVVESTVESAEDAVVETEDIDSVVEPDLETEEEEEADIPDTKPSKEPESTPKPNEEPEVTPTPNPTPAPAPAPTPGPEPNPAPKPTPDEPAVHVHTLVEEVTEATCETGKVITTKCSSCGHVEGTRTEGSGLGHDYRESMWYEATCYSTGYKTVKCIRCNAKGPGDGNIPMLPHSFYIKILVEGDCRSPQVRQNICSVCGHEDSYIEDWDIHANDHVWITGTYQDYDTTLHAWVDKERTCCSVCGMDKP